ncbi:Hypothetical protein PHPALM_11880 [Phytophthora palmivora]|uniref:Uncharacterized protein n=1 Tax=Phytophthora palmivora TaxID=4796 RepID=A0A2P4Y158_9STRA|nr:Hypothetical protein PHPALM_11880 [Phytophthora palmivora]
MVGDVCASYYKDRMDADDAEEPWTSDTLKYLEKIGIPTTDSRGNVRHRVCVMVVGNSCKTDPQRTKFCHKNKRDPNFEKRLQGHESGKKKRNVSSIGGTKTKKAKLEPDSDDNEEEAGEQLDESDVEIEEEANFQDLCDRMSQYVGSMDPSTASVILATLDFDPLARMNLKAVATSLCKEMCHLAAGSSHHEATSEDADKTNAVAHLETLHKNVEKMLIVQSEKATVKPEEMTMEYLNATVDLVKCCNDALTATTSFLLKAPLSEAEQERRQHATSQRHQDQATQLEEILTQCSKNVEECRAAATQASKNTEDAMVSVREKTEAFLNLASRESQDAVNRASTILRTSKTIDEACKEELLHAEHEHELAQKLSALFHQARTVRTDLQKMVAAGQYEQRAKESLARYVVVLTRAVRTFFLASFLQQKQDVKELEEKNDELMELVRRATKQQFLESEIGDIQSGLDELQRQRIQTMWSQRKLWTTRNLNILTPDVKLLLERCYQDVLDMLMKKGDDHPEWEEIRKAFEEKGNDDTDEEPIA